MTSRDFCYWLQGFFEVTAVGNGPDEGPVPTIISQAQAATIRKHLDMVFIHEIDPSMGPKPHQDKLTQAHAGSTRPSWSPEPTARC